MTLDDLPPRLRRRLVKELEPGERVMWVTRPKPSLDRGGALWNSRTVMALGMLLLVALTADPWHGGWAFWFLVGTSLLVVSFVLSFLYSLWPGRPVYAVTDRRAILLTFGWGGDLNYWYAEDLGRMHTRPGPDGSGEVIFGNEFNTYVASSDYGEVQNAERVYNGAWYGVPDLAEAGMYLAALRAHGSIPASGGAPR